MDLTDLEIEEGYKKYLEDNKQVIGYSSIFELYTLDKFKYFITINREFREKYIDKNHEN